MDIIILHCFNCVVNNTQKLKTNFSVVFPLKISYFFSNEISDGYFELEIFYALSCKKNSNQ